MINPHSVIDPISVACAADENYAMSLAVTATSLTNQLADDDRVDFYILSLGLNEQTKYRIRRSICGHRANVSLSFIEVDYRLVEGLPQHSYYTSAIYLRLLLPSLIPPELGKILYLDSDLLVRKNIRPLWDIDLGSNFLGAAWDHTQTVSVANSFDWQALGMEPDNPYFNSGVLLLNLNAWRKENLSESLIKFVEQNDQLIFPDQDALNAVCYKRWNLLDLTWNVSSIHLDNVAAWQDSTYRNYILAHYEDVIVNPSICHFTTKNKPWVPGFRMPFQTEWFKSLKESGWFMPAEYHEYIFVWTVKHYYYGLLKRSLSSGAKETN